MALETDQAQRVVYGRGLTKTFRDFWGRKKVAALDDVDIEIEQGQIFGLLGPNGAGKSTLIKLILGHLFPTSGRISVLGKDPRDVENKHRIGYLPERSQLYKQLTAEETLRYFGELLGLNKEQIEKRSEQLLEMVGLTNAKRRKIGEFSHGMGRRMGLAQALLNDPEFLILDEPTAGLDPVGCREVKDLILTLSKRGKTVLLTSHLLADVEDVCDQLMLVYGGKQRAAGATRDLLHDRGRMRLEFPRVSDKTLGAVEQVLKGELGELKLEVATPSESLEQFFLKSVAANNAETETAGAKMGTGVADFLQDEAYEAPKIELDEQLLGQLGEEKPKAPVVAAGPAVDTAALGALNENPAPAPVAEDDGVKRSLLDDLK
ncbi:MAG TPA: ABC transporter ATP-binding protein [Lentisphaeria bacterium]|nr:ABC transporter ATP-binding protein [Lentisphaeria bacterium]